MAAELEGPTQTYARIVGANIRVLRTQQDMTQETLGDAVAMFLGRERVVKQTISAIEKGNRVIDVEELIAIASVLDTTTAKILEPAHRGQPLPPDTLLDIGESGTTAAWDVKQALRRARDVDEPVPVSLSAQDRDALAQILAREQRSRQSETEGDES